MLRNQISRLCRLLMVFAILYSGTTPAALQVVSDTLIPTAVPFEYNGNLYFTANVPGAGFEMVTSNGTAGGTGLFMDIEPGAGSSGARPQFIYNGELYFTATNTASGHELWKTDGTVPGTSVIDNFAGAAGFNGLSNFIEYNGIVYFKGFTAANGSEIWRTDGTVAGTFLVSDILSGTSSGGFDDPEVYNGLLYFRATNGSFGAGRGQELWRTNGTGPGTIMFADINTGNDSSAPRYMTSFGGFLYFSCNNGAVGVELCRSDGITAGLFADIRPGSQFFSSSPENFIIVGGNLYFDAFLGTTEEMWRVTSANFLNRVQAGLTLSPMDQVNFNNDLVYQSNGIIYRTDGSTDGGVQIVSQNGSITSARNFAVSNGRVYFSGVYFLSNSTGFELMRSDGTNAGTTIMADIAPGGTNSFPTNLVDYNNTLYFSATSGGVTRWYSFVEESGNISLDSPTATVSEDGGMIDINVTRAAGSNGFAQVNFTTSNGTATQSLDFTAVSTTVTWQPGVANTQVISVPILEDMLSEGDETFTVSISTSVGATLGTVTTTTVTITDNDVPLVANADNYSIDEDGNLVADDADGMGTGGDSSDDGVLANDTGPGSLMVTTTGMISATGLGGSVDMAADGTFTYTPPMDAFGQDSFEYMMTDGGGTQAATVTITVNPINDAPILVPGPSQFFTSGVSGLQTIPGWVQSVDLGPGENGQSVLDYNIVQVIDGDSVLNSVDVLNDGTLEIDLTGSSGSARIDLSVTDDGGTANSGDQDTSDVHTFFVSVDRAADVGVTAVQCDSLTGPGFAHDYGLTISNNGPDATSEVIVDISFTGEIDQITATSMPAGSNCMGSGNDLLCTLTTAIPSGSSDFIDLSIVSDIAATSDIVMSVQVTGLDDDTNVANNNSGLSAQMIQDLVATGGFESCTTEE